MYLYKIRLQYTVMKNIENNLEDILATLDVFSIRINEIKST